MNQKLKDGTVKIGIPITVLIIAFGTGWLCHDRAIGELRASDKEQQADMRGIVEKVNEVRADVKELVRRLPANRGRTENSP